MGHVYISFGRADRAYVGRLAAELETNGIDVWFDTEAGQGPAWDAVLARKVESCDAMIVLMSPAARDSSLVASELELCRARAKPLVPVLLEGEPLPGLHFSGITDVRGDSTDGARLADAVRRATGPVPAAQPPAAPPVQPPAQPAVTSPAPPAVSRLELISPTLVQTLTGHTDAVAAVAFSPSGGLLATSSWDCTVRLWDVHGVHRAILAGHTDWVTAVAFSADGSMLVTGGNDETVRFWDVTTGGHRSTLPNPSGGVRSLAYSRVGHLAVAGWDPAVAVWDPGAGQSRQLVGHSEAVGSVAFSPDAVTIATACDDGTIGLWDAATGRRRLVLAGHEGEVRSVAFSPDGAWLATAGEDATTRVVDARTGVERLAVQGHSEAVSTVAFSPTIAVLATGGDARTVLLSNAATGARLHTVEGHGGAVSAVAFSPDGTLLATASDDNTARLWRVARWH